jgi:hypothetical protein
MLLADADPSAAHALCNVLQRRAADEDPWVYYKMAPTIPILRMTDLAKAGCPLRLPPSRLQSAAPGQEEWTDAVEHLHQIESGEGGDTYRQTDELLQKLSADNFSFLARNPPLLYHNDLTASIRRFYWSEEFGYALWLRLYFETEQARRTQPCGQGNATQICTEN